jgi:hypothetical protein
MQKSSGQSGVGRWFRVLAGGMTVAALCGAFAREATAACVSKVVGAGALVGAAKSRLGAQPSAATAESWSMDAHTSIVGLWDVTFLFGNGPDVYDRGFQHWHADGTELMVDNAVSPAFGNVCVGVWEQAAARTYKLKHVTFNWDAEGKLAGTFVLLMTVRLDRRGNAYAGAYRADSFDLAGKVIPELHVEGAVRGSRITVR